MKILLSLALALAFLLLPLSGRPETRQKMEEHLLKAVQQNPASEEANYNYASFLYGQMRFAEAEKYLNKLQQLAPESARAQRLRDNSQKVQSVKDPKKRKTTMQVLANEEMRLQAIENTKNMKAAKPVHTPVENPIMQMREEKVRGLEERYHVSKVKDVQYVPTIEEARDLLMPIRQEKAEEYREAERLFVRYLERYPGSPRIYSRYIQFLVRQNMMEKVPNLIKNALGKFPDQVELRILQDRIDQLHKAANEGQKIVIKRDLQTDMLILSQMMGETQAP